MKISGLRKEVRNLSEPLIGYFLLQISLRQKFRIRIIIFVWSAQQNLTVTFNPLTFNQNPSMTGSLLPNN